jgi:hypothetical protein
MTFKLVQEQEVPAPPLEVPSPAARVNAQMLMLSLRAVSQRMVTALAVAFSSLQTAALVISVWWLFREVLPNPTNTQLWALGGYALFCLFVESIRRRK